MSVPFIGPDAEGALDWIALTDALAEAHTLPPGEVADSFVTRGDDTVLTRTALIPGLGVLTKTATIFPRNAAAGRPTVNGAVVLFSDGDGAPEAFLDFALVTRWKTAGDSLLAARRLARPDTRTILIVGAGTVAGSLRAAYGAGFPGARFAVWNRSPEGAARLAADWPDTRAVDDLPGAVAEADIVTVATLSKTPVIRGDWLCPGQHLDLIGAFRADMREADDTALLRSRIFVDARATTIEHIGELADPIARGVIRADDVVADFRDLDRFRRADSDITLFKNGGGAHLDLMTARYIRSAVSRQAGASA